MSEEQGYESGYRVGCRESQAEMLRMQAEIERLQASEAELYDKCVERQKLVWKLEAAAKSGGTP